MSINTNDNLKLRAGKPLDSRYLTTGNTVYISTGATNIAIPIGERYSGLTVNVGGNEYWYKSGLANTNLVLKNTSVSTVGDYVTGATNIGFVNIKTGIQTLALTGFPSGYNVTYYSLYNNYYRDGSGIVRIGTPTYNGIYRRGYVDATLAKSWLYNTATSSWVLTDVDISKNVGNVVTNVSTSTYTNATWNTGVTSSGGTSVNAAGSLTTGSTYYGSVPVYNNKTYNNLNLRTLTSTIPNTKFVYDDAFIYLSGTSVNLGITGATNGLTKYNSTNVCLGGNVTTSLISVTGASNSFKVCTNGTSYNSLLHAQNGTISIFSAYPTNSWSGTISNAGFIGVKSESSTNCSNFIVTPNNICVQLNTGVTNTGLMYFSNYSSKMNACDRVIPDVGWVKSQITGTTYGGPLIKSVCLPGTAVGFAYQAVNTDWYIGVSACTCVTLPAAPPTGQEIIVADISCHAGDLNSCIIVTGGPNYIYGYPVAEINTKYGSMTFIWNSRNWGVVGFSPAFP